MKYEPCLSWKKPELHFFFIVLFGYEKKVKIRRKEKNKIEKAESE